MVVKYDYYDSRTHKYAASVIEVPSSQDILCATRAAVTNKYPERDVYTVQLRPSPGLKIPITSSVTQMFVQFRDNPYIFAHKGYLVLMTGIGTVVCYNPFNGAVYRTTMDYSLPIIRRVHRFFEVLGVPSPVRLGATWEEWEAVPFNNSYPKW